MGTSGEMYWTAGHGTDPDNVFEWHFTKNYGSMLEFPMNYFNWKFGEPSNENAQSCMAVSGSDYEWEVFECSSDRLCAICEIDP